MKNGIKFDDKSKIYTINNIAEITGVHPQTLRNWERKGLVNPERISGHQRIYTGESLGELEDVLRLRERKYNVSAIVAYRKFKELKEIDNIFENKDTLYSINEVSKIAQIHPQTLRNWERTGLLGPDRVSGNQRLYLKKDLERIEKIIALKNLKFNITCIKELQDELNILD